MEQQGRQFTLVKAIITSTGDGQQQMTATDTFMKAEPGQL
jgi:hypothetical protein